MNRFEAPPLPDWLGSQVPFERYRLDVGDGLKMHIMETGHGRPVLMQHGNPSWGFLYRRVAEALRGQPFRCIMPDLIGLGFSDKPRDAGVHSVVAHGRWLGAALDQLSLEGAIFVGQDWGGPIGVHAFSKRASQLSGMVVLNTVLSPPRPGFKAAAFHRLSHVPVVSDVIFRAGIPEAFMWSVQGDRTSIRGEVAKAYRYPLRHVADRVAPLAMARMAPHRDDHPSIEALQTCAEFSKRFRGPVTLVWGRRDPVIARALKRTRALFVDPAVIETQAGHFLQEEVPQDIANAIIDVARRLG